MIRFSSSLKKNRFHEISIDAACENVWKETKNS